MRKLFDLCMLGLFFAVGHVLEVAAAEVKTISEKHGLSITCLSEPNEPGWRVDRQVSIYTLLKNEDVPDRYRLVVQNWPCFYILKQKSIRIGTLMDQSERGALVEISGNSYPPYADFYILQGIVEQLRDQCDKSKFSEFNSLPSVPTNLKGSLEEHCTSQVSNVLQFHSIYVHTGSNYGASARGLHFILGRPFDGWQEIDLW